LHEALDLSRQDIRRPFYRLAIFRGVLEYQWLPHGYLVRAEPEPPHLFRHPRSLPLPRGDEVPVRRDAGWNYRHSCRRGQPDRSAPRTHEPSVVSAQGAFREDAYCPAVVQ
jgi:hypothetical protein